MWVHVLVRVRVQGGGGAWVDGSSTQRAGNAAGRLQQPQSPCSSLPLHTVAQTGACDTPHAPTLSENATIITTTALTSPRQLQPHADASVPTQLSYDGAGR
jgi:hypothetical protein